MGSQRTSNKDILAAIEAQTAAIGNLASAIAGQAQVQAEPPVLTDVVTPEPEPVTNDTVKVPTQYRTHVMGKVQAKCNADGEDRILYARRNLSNEVKLAYCLASRWTTLKDRGLIGAIAHVKPE